MSEQEEKKLPANELIARLIVTSGGQAGADRGAWDAAIVAGLPYAGYIPANRRAEDGRVPAKYKDVITCIESSYEYRTKKNVRVTSHTVIIAEEPLNGGSLLTKNICDREGRPCIVLDAAKILKDAEYAKEKGAALQEYLIRKAHEKLHKLGHISLNVNFAGSRESKMPGIQVGVYRFLHPIFTEMLRRTRVRNPKCFYCEGVSIGERRTSGKTSRGVIDVFERPFCALHLKLSLADEWAFMKDHGI